MRPMDRRPRSTAIVCLATAAAVATAVACSPASAAQPTKRADYEWTSGAIDDIDGGSFHVSKSGAKLTNIFLLASMTCSNGVEDVGLFIGGIEEPPARLPIAADGSFAGTFSVSPELRNPFAVTEEFRLSGKFIRHGRAVRVSYGSRAVGEAGTTCDSGDLTATGLRQSRKRRS